MKNKKISFEELEKDQSYKLIGGSCHGSILPCLAYILQKKEDTISILWYSCCKKHPDITIDKIDKSRYERLYNFEET